MKIAVIPARGGSKRIPGKNIKPFCGKPMICWSIDAAKRSGLFDRIIVSTDDEQIAAIAIGAGAEVPFLRPAALSDDYVGAAAVIAHATQWVISQGTEVDAVCCLLATAPFIDVSDLRTGWSELEKGSWAYVFTATDFAAPIFRSFQPSTEGGVEMFFPEHFNSRSQDLPTALHDAGQFYWGRTAAWIEEKRVFERHSKPLIIPRWRVQDIDTAADWTRAELIAPGIFKELAR
jgi:pseudaminic acid cytidylyltransferase